jgi:5-formyltetrahydrofolate cyclo-ligase
MNKDELRKVYLQKRLALTEDERAHFNLAIYHQFFTWPPLNHIQQLHIYLPLDEKAEPDTWQIIDKLRREHAHIRLVIPKVINDQLEHYYFEGIHQLQKSRWNIWEPKQGVPAPIEKIDAVLVPLLVCDKVGHRVGYGKGFYDRFLIQCKPDCIKVGISFFESISTIDGVEPTDVKLTGCFTPHGITHF